ncbi:MAG TPA: hypothetical protein VGM67_08895 [Gemmatimonadaceae bacterium]
MQKTLTVLLMLARLLWVVQLIVGLCLWFGALTGAVAFHMSIGSLFVLDMWIISLIALFALPTRRVALFALVWGGFLLWFGMAQVSILVGSPHWIVRLVHLLVGVAAIALIESLTKAVKRHKAAQATA